MNRGLGNHVQHYLAQVVKPPVGPEFFRPLGRRRIKRSRGNHGVREFDLAPVQVKHLLITLFPEG